MVTPLDQAEIDFDNKGGETYICGNPPYSGSVVQNSEQTSELRSIFQRYTKTGWKSLDYVAAWFMRAVNYGRAANAHSAFVATNSICQGEQVPILWPLVLEAGHQIEFAVTSFKWSNLAQHNAGVSVVIVGLALTPSTPRRLFECDERDIESLRTVSNIGPYLVAGPNTVIYGSTRPLSGQGTMVRGNMPNDGGHLILTSNEAEVLRKEEPQADKFIRYFVGSREFIHSTIRHCLWIEDDEVSDAMRCAAIAHRISKVRETRVSGGKQARDHADRPHRFVFAPHRNGPAIIVPRVSSERREYLPFGLTDGHSVISERNFVLYSEPLWNAALIGSRLHWVWISIVCARHEMRFSYSNTIGWNTFPVPMLTDQNKVDLTRCAEDILLAREAHWPATIGDLYDREKMPTDLREAHDRNDATLERIYIGRRFRNDTERLEKLFAMYAKMVPKRMPARTEPVGK